MEIYRIYDNGGITWDRYTVLFREHLRINLKKPILCLGLSENCDSPQGFSQWGEAVDGEHLGEAIKFEKLPENVQKHILERIK